MPLVKSTSKNAFRKNIKAEIASVGNGISDYGTRWRVQHSDALEPNTCHRVSRAA